MEKLANKPAVLESKNENSQSRAELLKSLMQGVNNLDRIARKSFDGKDLTTSEANSICALQVAALIDIIGGQKLEHSGFKEAFLLEFGEDFDEKMIRQNLLSVVMMLINKYSHNLIINDETRVYLKHQLAGNILTKLENTFRKEDSEYILSILDTELEKLDDKGREIMNLFMAHKKLSPDSIIRDQLIEDLQNNIDKRFDELDANEMVEKVAKDMIQKGDTQGILDLMNLIILPEKYLDNPSRNLAFLQNKLKNSDIDINYSQLNNLVVIAGILKKEFSSFFNYSDKSKISGVLDSLIANLTRG